MLDDVDVSYTGAFGNAAIYDNGGPLAINAGTFEDNGSRERSKRAVASNLVVTGETAASS